MATLIFISSILNRDFQKFHNDWKVLQGTQGFRKKTVKKDLSVAVSGGHSSASQIWVSFTDFPDTQNLRQQKETSG